MTDQSTLRALVAYESMFGNTERVARAVAAGLRLEGIDTTVVNVSDARARRPGATSTCSSSEHRRTGSR